MKAISLVTLAAALFSSGYAHAEVKGSTFRICVAPVERFVQHTLKLSSEHIVSMETCEELNDEGDTVCKVTIRQAGDESGFSTKNVKVGFNNTNCSGIQFLK